jgi:hypothetical protein
MLYVLNSRTNEEFPILAQKVLEEVPNGQCRSIRQTCTNLVCAAVLVGARPAAEVHGAAQHQAQQGCQVRDHRSCRAPGGEKS